MIPSLLSGLTTKIKRMQQQPRNKINENIIFSEKSLTGFSLENYPAENMCLDFFFIFFIFFFTVNSLALILIVHERAS